MATNTNIVETVIAPPPSQYEAYLYCYTNLITNQKYIGIHKGSVDDDYSHSSTNTEFAEVFSDLDSQLKFEVLNYDSYSEMQQLEHELLKKVDARNNPLYYNKSNGFPVYSQPNLDKCKKLVDEILAGMFNVGKEPISVHVSMVALQVRFMHDASLQKIIKEKIDDAKGNTDECSPVLVWEERGENGEDIRGDGSHTVFGASSSKHCVDIPVIRVPYDVHKDFSDNELRTIGNLLNKRPKFIKKPMDNKDGVKHILDNNDQGVPYDSIFNVNCLKEFGFTGTAKKGTIYTIIKEAKAIIDKKQLASGGSLWKNYAAKPHHQEMLNAVDFFSKRPNTTSTYMSSRKFSLERIVERLYAVRIDDGKRALGIEDVKKIIVVIHHPDPEAEKEWKKEIQPTWINIIDYVFNGEFEVKFYEMESTQSDISESAAA